MEIPPAIKRISGSWEDSHISLGDHIDVHMEILTKAKVDGARIMISRPDFDAGYVIAETKSIQEIRGSFTHYSQRNAVWRFSAKPLDLLMGTAQSDAMPLRAVFLTANFGVPSGAWELLAL